MKPERNNLLKIIIFLTFLIFLPISHISNAAVIRSNPPQIIEAGVSPNPVTVGTSALIYAVIRDDIGIIRVMARIIPPYSGETPDEEPVLYSSSVKLIQYVEDGRYEGWFDGFDLVGVYKIAIYAEDWYGNPSIPIATEAIVEDKPLRQRAIIVTGTSHSGDLQTATAHNANLAYNTLTSQGYSDENIYFMSSETLTGTDGTATLNNLEYAVTTWASEDTHDLVIYLTGSGEAGIFQINDTETLSANDLDVWLDQLQENIPGKVTLIYDADYSGSFIPLLTPPEEKERILITGTSVGQPALFLSDGVISFSNFLWKSVSRGVNLSRCVYECKGCRRHSG